MKGVLQNAVGSGFYGISFVLSDRQIITHRPGLQGISMVLSDRQIITQRPGLQGITMVLGNKQPFNFNHGITAILIGSEANDEQWFQPKIGLEGIDIETTNPTGRGYIIKK